MSVIQQFWHGGAASNLIALCTWPLAGTLNGP